GVQTCALPISPAPGWLRVLHRRAVASNIGRDEKNYACATNGRNERWLHRRRIICWSSGIEISVQTAARTSPSAPELAAATRPKADSAVSTANQVLRDRIG